MSQTDGVLGLHEFLAAVSGEIDPHGERVIYTAPLKRPLALSKAIWQEHFGDWPGIRVKLGKEVIVVRGTRCGNRLEMPDRAIERLGLGKGDTVCLTFGSGRFALKKIELVERELAMPGWIIYDEFGATTVRRTFAKSLALEGLNTSRLREMLSELGRFRYDPLGPLQQVGGLTGARIRRELLGSPTAQDRETLKQIRSAILAGQESNGSWQGSVVHTSYAIARLLDAGCTRRNAALRKAVGWLLASPSPTRMPGMFMSTNWLAEKHNAWKAADPRSGEVAAFRDIFMAKQAKTPKSELMSGFRANTDLHGAFDNFCGVEIMRPTAVALEALLRTGQHEHPRVRRLVETLLRVPWCQGDMSDLEAQGRSRPQALSFSDAADSQRAQTEGEWDMTARRAMSLPKYDMRLKQIYAFPLDNGKTVWRRLAPFHSCSSSIATALSYHPEWRRTGASRSLALATLARQSPDWAVPRTYPSFLLSFLDRQACTIAAYAGLRVVPTLIRTQHRDGLWHEAAAVLSDPAYGELLVERVHADMRRGIAPPLAPEQSTFLILRALKTFGFLDALLPSSRRSSPGLACST